MMKISGSEVGQRSPRYGLASRLDSGRYAPGLAPDCSMAVPDNNPFHVGWGDAVWRAKQSGIRQRYVIVWSEDYTLVRHIMVTLRIIYCSGKS